MTTIAKRLIDAREVQRAYDLLIAPDQIVEVRALKASKEQNTRYKSTLSGYFDNIRSLLNSLSQIRIAKGIYITLQACNPDLLDRAENKLIQADKDDTTSDKHITRYRWLLLDSDPGGENKVSNISSTEREHDQALSHSQSLRDELTALGWPSPIMADSGNGAHLLYRIDLLPSDKDLVERVLKGLADSFDSSEIHLDQAVFNPARICKLYGTLACKGDDTTRRPHRMSRLLSTPSDIQTVTREQLEVVAAPLQLQENVPYRIRNNGYQASGEREPFTAEAFLQKNHVRVLSSDPYEGGTRYHLAVCAWDSDHTDDSACVYQFSDGRLGASCSHNSCKGKGWKDFRRAFEPDYVPYDERQAPDRPIVTSKKEKAPATDQTATEGEKPDEQPKEKQESVAKLLVKMAEPLIEVFCNSAGTRFVRVLVHGHYETMIIGERGSFRRWLHNLYEETTGNIPNSKAISDAIHTFESRAQFRSKKKQEVYLRVAYLEETNTIYLDMANDAYQVIEITANGWKILNQSPVCFRRTASMLPLPEPATEGSVDELRPFINCRDEDWILIKAWVLAGLQPSGLEFGEYPILNLNGGQGAAKTAAARKLRSILDPSVAPLRKQPKDDQSFSILAHNNFIVGIDNLSHISNDLSDSMCTLSTGAGDAYRKLYTDDEETIFVAQRPQIFTGIEQLATRGDLLDRCLLITMLEISDEQRKDSTTLNKDFKAVHPRILGAFLDCASLSLKNRGRVKMEKMPRLADFAKFVVASESLLSGKPGEFMEAYAINRKEGVASEIEASPVASAVIKFMKGLDACTYTATEMLKELTEAVNNEQITKSKAWPQSPRGLSAQLKRLARSLHTMNLCISFDRNGAERTITVTRGEQASSNDAKPSENDAKPSENDAKPSPMTQSKSVCVTPETQNTGHSNRVVTQSDAKSPSFPLSARLGKRENEESEGVDINNPEILRHFASSVVVNPSSPIHKICNELEKYLEQCAPGRSVEWLAPGTSFGGDENVTVGAYKDRVIEELGSQDPKRITAMVNAMRKLLGKVVSA